MNHTSIPATLLALLATAACGSKPAPATSSAAATPTVVTAREGAARPRFSPDGARIAFHAGADGARQIFVMNADGSGVRQLTELSGDNIDAAWGPDGERILFSSNADGDYDLYLVPAAGGEPVRVTDLPGDEIEPTVSSLRYAFYAVRTDGCSSEGAAGRQVDGYEKVVFTRRYGEPAAEEVWFASIAPVTPPTVAKWNPLEQVSPHATHSGRLSPDGARCREPAFSGDGLSLVWSCDDGAGALRDNEARWDQDFAAALKTVSGEAPEACLPESWDETACFEVLPRRYSRYVSDAPVAGSAGLARPSVSANQIVLVADRDGRALHRPRGGDGDWQPFPTDARDIRNVVWAPDGARVAFDAADGDDRRRIVVLPTDFYLQQVRNLNLFPELYGAHRSQRLQDHRFVARPGGDKEFYALYEKLRYQRRPQYVTADAALQAFRDEFLMILQRAEREAASELRALSKAMADHYAARYARTRLDSDRYYAAYFATAWVPLEAAATMETLDTEDYMEAQYAGGDDPEVTARFERLGRPVIDRLPGEIGRVAKSLPPGIRGDVGKRVEAMLAHEGIGDLPVPSRPRPARVDWTQFRVRGAYADNELAGYFLAMSWYAQAPLVFDDSLPDLLDAMDTVKVGKRTAYEAWAKVDGTVGAFMGKPVDATLAHLRQVRAEQPKLLQPFEPKRLAKKLEELRGPMPLRDAEAAEGGGTAGRRIQLTLLPKRMGLDTTFFRALTHPAVEGRGMPTALDVMAVLGGERARALATAAQDAAYADAYRAALAELVKQTPAPADDPGYWSTDIYHSWLAALVALATANDVPADSLIAFAKSEAWRDRLLASALGGYTQLKHAAVLYNMQDMGVECGSDDAFFVMVEQPILPTPRGFVDPMPGFFDRLAGVADRVYRQLYDRPDGPAIDYWRDDDDTPLNARNFARDLAEIARREIAGEPLTDAQLAWIEYVGARLETLTLRSMDTGYAFNAGPNTRGERGIVLVTDIHTNLTRQQVLEIGIGRVMNLYVAVPDRVGQNMTQGGMFSFYELTEPMSARMTDAEWAERVAAGKLPDLPAWTESFVEPAPAGATPSAANPSR